MRSMPPPREILDTPLQLSGGSRISHRRGCQPHKGAPIPDVVTFRKIGSATATGCNLRRRSNFCQSLSYGTEFNTLFLFYPEEEDDDDSFAPEFVRRPKSCHVDEGSPAVFKCQVAADPPPSVTWEKDGQQIVNGGRYRVRIGAKQPNLKLQGCTKSNSRDRSECFQKHYSAFLCFFSVACFFLMGWSAFCAFFSPRVSAFFLHNQGVKFLFFPIFPIFKAISSYFSYFLAILHVTCISYISFQGFLFNFLFFLSGAHQLLKISQPHFFWHYFIHI